MNALEALTEVYRTAANGNEDAARFLGLWHQWCHDIDDFVDDIDLPRSAVVGICARSSVLFGCPFFAQHYATLAPLVAVTAEKYAGSLETPHPVMHDVLRLAGNDVVLAVAVLTGGWKVLQATRKALVPIIIETQL